MVVCACSKSIIALTSQMRMSKNAKKQLFQKRVLTWFQNHRRDLPWRKTRDPYKILVSEIMLQQTQVERVIPKYEAFLRKFPTVQKLAAANRSTVIKLWSGLGYNNRAVRLHRAAQTIVRDYHGKFPRSLEALEALPGIGSYTARAVVAFAFGAHVAAVDVNHSRVVARFFFGVQKVPIKKVELLSHETIPRNKSYEWNHALMDFGALVCKSRPLCSTCPLQKECKAYPAVLTHVPPPKKSTEPFLGSDRYFRGRIVHVLRSVPARKSISLQKLFENVSTFHDILPDRLYSLVSDLAKDGVVHVSRKGKSTTIRIA